VRGGRPAGPHRRHAPRDSQGLQRLRGPRAAVRLRLPGRGGAGGTGRARPDGGDGGDRAGDVRPVAAARRGRGQRGRPAPRNQAGPGPTRPGAGPARYGDAAPPVPGPGARVDRDGRGPPYPVAELLD
jgi:hypothetical protein